MRGAGPCPGMFPQDVERNVGEINIRYRAEDIKSVSTYPHSDGPNVQP